MGIETPLNTISITLQNERERNQNDLSKQSASATPLLIKGTKPQVLSAQAQQIQKFKKKNK